MKHMPKYESWISEYEKRYESIKLAEIKRKQADKQKFDFKNIKLVELADKRPRTESQDKELSKLVEKDLVEKPLDESVNKVKNGDVKEVEIKNI